MRYDALKLCSFIKKIMDAEIKLESGADICQGCLCQGRSLKPVGSYSEVLNTLLDNNIGYNFVAGSETMKMCWECIARLKKVEQFQMQLCQAQNRLLDILYNMNANVRSLSRLAKDIKNVYDYEYNYQPIEDNITKVTSLVEPEAVVHDVELNNVCLIKEEKLAINDETEINKDNYNCLDYSDNYSDKCNESNRKAIPKTKISIERKEKKYKNKIKNEKCFNRDYMNRTYREEVIVKNINVTFDKHNNTYFDAVYLDEREVEEFVCKKEREMHHSFKHKCSECKIGYMAIADFYRHQNFVHHKVGTAFKCRLCNKPELTLEALKTHWKFIHSRFYVCNLCNTHVRDKGQTKHLINQHMKKYCCTACKMEFQTMLAFSAHYRKEHGKFVCDYCGKKCKQKSILIKHINLHHKIHECLDCDKSFKSYRMLRHHLTHLHPEKLIAKVDMESAYCVECNRQFASVNIYRRHLKESPRHTPKVPQSFPCFECGKIYRSEINLRNHISHVHATQKRFHCAKCNKSFANNGGLKYHKLYVHLKVPKVKDKICDLCGRGFHTVRVLTHHRRTHTGERPYACGYCSATFAQRTAMMTHQKTQHRDLQ